MKSSILLRLSLLGIMIILSHFICIKSEEKEFAIELVDLFEKDGLVEDKDKVDFDDSITADILVDEMGFGWNLGNTLDAYNYEAKTTQDGLDSETMWGNPKTNEEMIQELLMKGFRTLRIPVTWHNHLVDEKYTIDPKWMQRVKTVVDWGINNGLYVILNTHHDVAHFNKDPIGYGEGYYTATKDMEESERFIYNVWRQIATAFNNGYDHHLIFEGLNEPRMNGHEREWTFEKTDSDCLAAVDSLNEYMRLIVKAIRESGGNNEKRFIMITPLSGSYLSAINSNVIIPNDSFYNPDNNKLLISVHMYTPYNFALNGDMAYTKFTEEYKEEIYEDFVNLYKKYVSLGYNVVIGEMGTVNKNNTDDRMAWAEYFVKTARKFHMSCVLWDNGDFDNTKGATEIFGSFHRDKLVWENNELVELHITFATEPFEKIDVSELFAIELKDNFNKDGIIKDEGKKDFDDKITAAEISENIGMGWNLGNTLDAFTKDIKGYNQGLKSETCWGNPETKEEMIDFIAKSGFKTLRIPVTWHNHLIDERYTIDPEWMKRVKTIVDWGIKNGLYVILNDHHDNYDNDKGPLPYGLGYYPLKRDIKESEKFIYSVWRQIATAFNNGYDHHLIFEGLNEPRLVGTEYEWSYRVGNSLCEEADEVLNEYMQLIVKAIRESGGNNEKRFIMITPLAAGFQATMQSRIVLPDDSKYNPTNRKLMLSVHMYAPYNFALNADSTYDKFLESYKYELASNFRALYGKFVARDIQIVLGEMGTLNKNNTEDRIQYGKYYVVNARKNHLSCVLWDNGVWDNRVVGDDMGELRREDLVWNIQELTDVYVKAGKTPFCDIGVSDFAIRLEDKFNKENLVVDDGKVEFDDKLTSQKLVEEMKFGWNLGNSLDALNFTGPRDNGLDSEIAWGNPRTTEEMFKTLAEKGVKTFRIPVSWHNHLIDENYTIDPEWMKRVKTVVDWALKYGMYVIINSHHDNAGLEEYTIPYGKGYYPLYKDITESERFIYNVWRQIALAFNNGYDQRLIFEGLNQPRMAGHKYEKNYNKSDLDCQEAAEVLNEYMKLIVKVIRETGGNNEKRFILITPLNAEYKSAIDSKVVFPDDSKYNSRNDKLILSVHMYTPYNFAINGNLLYSDFTAAYREELYEVFSTLYHKYIANYRSVIIGEMGAVNKNNTEARIEWAKYFIRKARKFHMSALLWDNNVFDNRLEASEVFGHFHRDTLKWDNDDLLETFVTTSNTEFEKIDEENIFAINPQRTYQRDGLIRDIGEVEFDDTIRAEAIVEAVGMGWNLGNTLDAFIDKKEVYNQGLSSESCWGNPNTTEALIEKIAKTGFKSIRIPVTWHNHLIDENYTIDPEWMKRVKKIVDWSIKNGLYVILNTHHDIYTNYKEPLKYGRGYYPLKRDIKESEKFIYNVWKQITDAFNNGYDHHLIFEGLNEPRLAGTEYEWWYKVGDPLCEEAASVLNEFHRLILKAIRESGGNNEKRFVMVTPLAAGYQAALESNFVFPTDSKYNPSNRKILLSVHMYSPYNFALNSDPKYTKFEESYKDELRNSFKTLYKRFSSINQHVIIGEMGIVNKNNTQDRVEWAEYYVSTARYYHLSCVLWDNGIWDVTSTGEIIGELHRDDLTWHIPRLIDTYIKASKTEFYDFEGFSPDLVDTFSKNGLIIDKDVVTFDDSVTSDNLVNVMGLGWNLGNTLDAYDTNIEGDNGVKSEMFWGNPKTTEEMFITLAKKGIKTVRLPITWHNHIIDKNYTIDPDWIRRVKEIVDWAIKHGLYVIINSQHDNAQHLIHAMVYGEGYYPSPRDLVESQRFIYNLWRQIAIAFNNGYDHHLIFEGLSEPRLTGYKYDKYFDKTDSNCRMAVDTLNTFMRLIVKVIRETGGNNAKRFIMITPLFAGYQSAMESNVVFPDDSKYNPKSNKLILSIHMFAPYDFCMNGDMEYTKFTEAYKDELYENFVNLYKKYISKGRSIIIGEMGAVNKNNTNERNEWAKFYIKNARKFHMSVILWDNGDFDNTEKTAEVFGIFQRESLTWLNEDSIDLQIAYSSLPFEDIDNNELFSIELKELFNKDGLVVDSQSTKFDEEITASEISRNVGMGWNLGNTLDAFIDKKEVYNQGLSSESCWGNPNTTEALIEKIAKTGFKSIRIPVTWHNHLIDENYTIDPEWMKRVKKIVDWSIKNGLYVILNTHHDIYTNYKEPLKYGRGYYPLKRDIKESEKFIYNVWKQITTAFNNGYDHHLIFEGLNEPRLAGSEYEWWYKVGDSLCEEGATVLNEYMRLVVKAIRESGGNNEKRFIMVTPLAAGYQAAIESGFEFPHDSKYNPTNRKLILSVHMYAPYNFALNADKNYTVFEDSYKIELKNNFKTLYDKFVAYGRQVIIGEMGIVNKNNTEERLKWADYYIPTARYYHLSSVLWDNGIWDVTSQGEIIGELHRDELTWHIQELIDKYIEGSKAEFHNFAEDFVIELEDRYDASQVVVDEGDVEFDNSITSDQIVNEMGFGWNLGNTLDAIIWEISGNNGLDSEISWGNPKTTEEMFEALAKKGIKAVRIPVSWHNHLLDKRYTIDPQWMKRVKTVVDWAIKHGLYVILNTHHDNANMNERESIHYGQGYYPSLKDIEQSERFIYNIWRQIATAFNNGYDHHLIFEGLNEPRMQGHQYEWWYNHDDSECRIAASVLNEYMRLIVKAIRTTRGNNAKRFIMITPLSASFSSAINSNVIMPDDSLYNPINKKLILSVHMYTPYNFALNGDMTYTKFIDAYREELYEDFALLYKKYVANGYNVIIGEMGTVNKNNTEERIEWARYFVKKARKFHMAAVLWDNNIYDNTKGAAEIFGHFHRDTLEWEINELMEAYINAANTEFEEIDLNDIFAIVPQQTYNRFGLVRDFNEVPFNDEVTAENIANEVGMGWNLGNTLDAHDTQLEGYDQGLSSESSWGNPNTTEAMIKGLAERGFKTLRVPVTWHNHLIDENYTIDPKWMQRVKTIVDWGIKYGLYVILNIHHDNFFYREQEDKAVEYGKGFYPNKRNIKESEKFIDNIWSQIAIAFNNGYDHHLIFEGLNEPRLTGTQYEWWYKVREPICEEAAEVLNEYMRLVVKTIRETGGNNEKRFIMITPLEAGYQSAMESKVVFPDDSKYNPTNKKLILSVHMYSPYNFALNLDKSYNKFDQSGRDELKNNFSSLYNKFVKNGIQVIIGEMGVINKNNDADRIAWADYYVTTARRYHLSAVVWDNGIYDTTLEGQEILGEYHRDTCSWQNEDLIDAYIKGSKTEFEDF